MKTLFTQRWKIGLLLLAVVLLLTLRIGPHVAQASSLHSMAGWKLPLPAGNYYVVQGDADSSTYTHRTGQTNPSMRCAIDIVAPRDKASIMGTPLLAPADGTVLKVDYQADLAGYYINLQQNNGLVSQFMHLMKDSIVVKAGDKVKQGQPLARVDHTGLSTEAHLHYVVLIYNDKGIKSDCEKFINLDGNTNFRSGATIISTNKELSSLPTPPTSEPISPSPSLPPTPPPPAPVASSGSCSSTTFDDYLRGKSSPMAGMGSVFMQRGREYNVDPRFIIAIANAESSLGKHMSGSYNAWNEFKAGGGLYNFASWDESITFVSRHIGVNYIPVGQSDIPSYVYHKDTAEGTCSSHCFCAAGCQNWIPNVSSAYRDLGGDPATNNLTFSACGDVSRITVTPTRTSTPTLTKTVTPTVTASPTGTVTPVVVAKPPAPTLRQPDPSGMLSSTTDVWLSWNYAPGAEMFYLEYWGGPYGTLNSGWQYDTAYHIGTMWPGAYQWRVKARNAAGEGPWSETRSFTVAAPVVSLTPTLTQTPVPADTIKPDGGYNSPADGTQVQCEITLSAWASDGQSGVGEVHFTAKINGAWRLVASLSSEPYSYAWKICDEGVPDGDIELGLDVYDRAGNEFNASSKRPNPHIIKSSSPPPSSFTGNAAPSAQRSPDGINSKNAFDGDLSTFWIDGLGHAFNLTLTLQDELPVSRILVWDRPQNSPDNNQINALKVELSNGISGRFGMDSMGRRCIDISLPTPQKIRWVKLIADDASGNNGLGEVEIWVGSKTGGPTCTNTGQLP